MSTPDPSLEARRQAALADRLLAVARAFPVDERVPAGFAQRVQRSLSRPPSPEPLGLWLRGFGQALIPALGCLAIVAWLQPRHPAAPPHELETDNEAAVEISLWDAFDANTGEVEL